MKKILLILILLTGTLLVRAQERHVDTVAVMIIDRMASVIGELNSCSFTLQSTEDIRHYDYGLVKRTETSKVYLAGPDKMHVDTRGDKGHRAFWYNGASVIAYSFDENNYAAIDAPDNIISMIDSIHKDYGIEFPAADFFYPTFTDDILDNFDTLVYLGRKSINDRECAHILATNPNMSVQMWFSSDAFTLPQKFVILYKNEGNRQYEASFSDWKLNSDIPAAAFDFLPPPAARKVSIMRRTK